MWARKMMIFSRNGGIQLTKSRLIKMTCRFNQQMNLVINWEFNQMKWGRSPNICPFWGAKDCFLVAKQWRSFIKAMFADDLLATPVKVESFLRVHKTWGRQGPKTGGPHDKPWPTRDVNLDIIFINFHMWAVKNIPITPPILLVG